MPRETDSQRPNRPAGRRMRGFEAAGGLLAERIRQAGEKRGFAQSRLLTHWAEVVGPETAAMARPVKIGYNQKGLGAVLTLLTTASQAPILQMQLPRIRERVNACYGYNAVSRILITQTAPDGFSEPAAGFSPAPKPPPTPDPATCAKAAEVARGIGDDGLREALEALALNVLKRARQHQ